MTWTFLTNAIDITPTTTGAWVDVDLSSYVPEGTKTALLKIVNTADSGRDYGIRPKGSSETYIGLVDSFARGYTISIVKLDSARTFQAYISETDMKIFLWGYNDEDLCFLNPIDKSTTTTGTWVTVSCSAELPAHAKGAIFERRNPSDAFIRLALRPYGSSADYSQYSKMVKTSHGWAPVGLDENLRAEQYVEDASLKLYLWGYLSNDFVPFTDPIDITPTTTGAWVDVDLSSYVPEGTRGILVAFHNTETYADVRGDIRKHGSTDDHPSLGNGTIIGHGYVRWVLVGCSDDLKVDIFIYSTKVKVLLWGYFRELKESLAVSTTVTPSLTRTLTASRTLSVSTTATPSISARKIARTTLSVSTTVSSVLTRTLTASRTLQTSTTVTPTLERVATLSRTFTVSTSATTTVDVKLVKRIELPVSTTVTSTLQRILTAYRTLSKTITVTPTLRASKIVKICGLPDFTLSTNIRAQTIESIKVDIASQSIGRIDVNLASSDITLNVNVTNSTLDVNITNTTINVNITDSVDLNVNVTNDTLNVNVTNSTIDVNISNSVELNVNITNTELNVNVTNSTLTVTVDSGNITIESGTVNIGSGTLDHVKLNEYLLKSGVIDGLIAFSDYDDSYDTSPSVPSGYTFFITSAFLSTVNRDTSTKYHVFLQAYDSDSGKYIDLSYLAVDKDGAASSNVSFATPVPLSGGSYIVVHDSYDTQTYGGVTGILVSSSLLDGLIKDLRKKNLEGLRDVKSDNRKYRSKGTVQAASSKMS